MGFLRKLLSSRTGRLRGAAATVLVVLAGGWALGVAGIGGEEAADRAGPTTPSDISSETPSDTPTPEELDPSDLAGDDPSAASPSASESTDGAVEPVAELTDGDPEPSRTRSPDPTPTQGRPSSSPRPSQTPRPTPRPSPSETADCADPAEGVDCLLAPITTQP